MSNLSFQTPCLSRPQTLSLSEASSLGGSFIIQPKLDGIRACWCPHTRELIGKDGQILKADPIRQLLIEKNAPAIDGELWSPDHSFNQILSDYRTTGGRNLALHAFDIDRPAHQEERLRELHELSSRSYPIVPFQIIDPSEIAAIHRQHLARGYEGTILRRPDRSFSEGGIYKVKPHIDFEATMLDYNGLSGTFQPIKNPSGPSATSIFKCRTRGAIFPGDVVTIIVDSIHPSGKPRNPRMK